MYPLPKKVKRTEADVDGKVLNWLLKNYPRSFGYEVKVGKNKLLPHQKQVLKKIANGKFGYKIPDMGRRNPIDGFGLINGDALVCTVTGKNVSCIVNDTHEITFTI